MKAHHPAPPDLFSAQHVENPWPGLAILRDHYPVYWNDALGIPLVSRYDDIRTVMQVLVPGANMQQLVGQYISDAPTFSAMDGHDHRKRRALMAPFLARGGVDGLRERIERQARALLEPIFERERQAVAAGARERGEMDFITEFTASFPLNVIGEMLDLPPGDQGRIQAWHHAWIAAETTPTPDSAVIARAREVKDDFEAYIRPIIAERRDSGEDDFISHLCRGELEGGPVPDAEIQSFAGVMILGGGETTDHQLGWLMHALVQHPDTQRALIEDRDLMDKVLSEGMRYCSIIQYGIRTVTTDVEIHGVKIRAGDVLGVVSAAGNHDPRRFQNADEFDIYREDLDERKSFTGSAQHLAFGVGQHFCIGSHLAKAEMQIALNVFFDNARDVRLIDGFEARADPDAAFVRSLPHLRLSFSLV